MSMDSTLGSVATVGNGSNFPLVSNGERIRSRSAEYSFDPSAMTIRTSTNTLLQCIDPEHLLRLRQFIKRVTIVKDQYLYQQDDEIDVVYFPESAVVSEFQILEDGRTIEVGLIGSEG